MNAVYLYFLDCSSDFQDQLIFKILKFIFSIIFKISLALSATENNCLDARSQWVLLTMLEEGICDEIYGCHEMLKQHIQEIISNKFSRKHKQKEKNISLTLTFSCLLYEYNSSFKRVIISTMGDILALSDMNFLKSCGYLVNKALVISRLLFSNISCKILLGLRNSTKNIGQSQVYIDF